MDSVILRAVRPEGFSPPVMRVATERIARGGGDTANELTQCRGFKAPAGGAGLAAEDRLAGSRKRHDVGHRIKRSRARRFRVGVRDAGIDRRAGVDITLKVSIHQLVDIPDDLAAEAAQVPGIHVRLLSFLRAEIAQNRRRQRQVREVVRQAHAEAEKLKAAGMTPEQARAEFSALHQEVMEQIAAKA